MIMVRFSMKCAFPPFMSPALKGLFSAKKTAAGWFKRDCMPAWSLNARQVINGECYLNGRREKRRSRPPVGSRERWHLRHLYFQIQKGRILLAAKAVAFSGTAAGLCAENGEFDGKGRVEFHKIADSVLVYAKQLSHGVFV
jgi:hypothetical protein